MLKPAAENTLEEQPERASAMRLPSNTCWRAFPAYAAKTAIEHADSPEVLATYVGYSSHDDWRFAQVDAAQLGMVYCIGGSGRVRVGDLRYDVSTGQILVLPAGQVFEYRSHSDDPWTIYRVLLSGRRTRSVQKLLTNNDEPSIFRIGHDQATIAAIEAVYDAMRGHESNHLLMAFLATAKLVWRLAELSLHPSNALNKDDRIYATLKLMQARLAKNTSAAELARAAHLSRSRYSQVFKQEMGFSVLEYLIRTKMHRAAHWLEHSEEQVKKIANSVGFRDPLYFSRQFRQLYGVCPTDFRSIVRQPARNAPGVQDRDRG